MADFRGRLLKAVALGIGVLFVCYLLAWFAPWRSLVFSGFVVAFGGAYFFSPRAQNRILMLFRCDQTNPGLAATRVGATTAVACVLLLFSMTAIRSNRNQSLQKAEVDAANATVVSHLQNAQRAISAGMLDEADARLIDAVAVKDATNQAAIDLVKTNLAIARRDQSSARANAEVAVHLSAAEVLFNSGRIDEADKKVKFALAIRDATKTSGVIRLQGEIDKILKMRLARAADTKVNEICNVAEEKLQNGQLDDAHRELSIALTIEHATSKDRPESLLASVRLLQNKRLYQDALVALESGDFEEAAVKIREFLRNPSEPDIEAAVKHLKAIEALNDRDKALDFIKSFTDEELSEFRRTEILPPSYALQVDTLSDGLAKALFIISSIDEARRYKERKKAARGIVIPEHIKYDIINTDIIPDLKRSIDVRLSEKVSEDILRAIALKLKSQDPKPYERVFISYLLPGMERGAGAWATTNFNLSLGPHVVIIGLTVEEEKALKTEPLPSGEILGRWIAEFYGERMMIVRDGSKTYLHIRYKGTDETTKRNLVEAKSPLGRRFNPVARNEDREHWVINAEGNLEVRDKDGLIQTVRKFD